MSCYGQLKTATSEQCYNFSQLAVSDVTSDQARRERSLETMANHFVTTLLRIMQDRQPMLSQRWSNISDRSTYIYIHIWTPTCRVSNMVVPANILARV